MHYENIINLKKHSRYGCGMHYGLWMRCDTMTNILQAHSHLFILPKCFSLHIKKMNRPTLEI